MCSGRKSQINPTNRVPRTKNGEKCWTCAPVGEGRSLGMDTGHLREANSACPALVQPSNGMTGQRAMFWMLPLLWSFMDWPNSFFQASVRGPRDTVWGLSRKFSGDVRYIDLPQVFVHVVMCTCGKRTIGDSFVKGSWEAIFRATDK